MNLTRCCTFGWIFGLLTFLCPVLLHAEETSIQNDIETHSASTPSTTAREDDYAILGNATLPDSVYVNFLRQHNPKVSRRYAKNLVRTYRAECQKEGVRMDIAFAQMCHETGFLTYTGSVKPKQNNFAGIGAVNERSPGLSFSSMQQGIRVHVQHLKAYASQEPTRNKCIDERRQFVNLGCAPTIFELTGKWATDPMYGERIKNVVNKLYLSAEGL